VSAVAVERLAQRGVFYGWVIVGALALTETVSWGILFYAFSVFLVPMQRELGWSTATLTGGYSLALLVSGLAAPFVGRWIDRRGPRLLMTTGSVLGALMVLAWSQVGNLTAYYLLWAGIGLAMSATLYEPAFTTVTAWFERDRARAVLIVTILAGFASTIFLPLSAWLVDTLDWRDALLALAVILAVLTIPPHALLLRRRPEDLGLQTDGRPPSRSLVEPGGEPILAGVDLRAALRDRAFWWLAIAFSLETFASAAVAVHLIPYLTERGDGARFAAAAAGAIGAAQVVARIIATVFGGRVSQVALTGIVFALQAVAVGILLEWRSQAGVLTAVLLLGAGRGVVTLMRAGLVAEFYGRAHYGSINGTLALFLTVARSLAPVGAGVALVVVGNYEPIYRALAGCSLIAALAMAMVARSRGRQQMTLLAS
jgi:sugar phosphate permease